MRFLRRKKSPLPTAPTGSTDAPRTRRADDPRARYADVLSADLEPGLRDVRDRLMEHGASLGFTVRAVRAVRRTGARGAYAIDAVARLVGRAFPILPSPKRPRRAGTPHVIAFVGPTGAGKTTTVAKLGRKLAAAGRRVGFLSLDAVGATALERVGGVAADRDRGEIPLVAIRDAADLPRALRKLGKVEVLLIDTPGLSPRGDEDLDALARRLERIGHHHPLEVLLVLPATRSRASLELACWAFARTTPTGCVLTKLDETDRPGVVLERISSAVLPVAFLCDGQDTRGHLARPTPDRFADLLLRGRIK